MELKKFDIKKMDDNGVSIMIGMTYTGKSFLIRDICYHKQYITRGQVMHGTEYSTKFYSHFVPDKYIDTDWSEKKCRGLIEDNEIIMENKRNGYDKEVDPRSFLILDDLMYDTSWFKTTPIKKIIGNPKSSLMTIITMQYQMALPRIRDGIKYIFIFRCNINRLIVYKIYGHFFPNYEIFEAIMDKYCNFDFETIVISRVTGEIFWYCAQNNGPFTMDGIEIKRNIAKRLEKCYIKQKWVNTRKCLPITDDIKDYILHKYCVENN